MKKEFEITFNFLHNKHIGYFEIADLEELCDYETKTRVVKAETSEKANNIIRNSFGKTVSITNTRELQQERERTL